jgi:hypothetical protein
MTPYEEYQKGRHSARDLTVIFLILLVSYFVVKKIIDWKREYTE